MSIALNGWHPGERSIQERLNFAGPMAMAYTWIDSSMPEQHRTFHTRNLPFVPITTLDSDGRPWSSIAAGRSGLPGFISSPNETELDVELKLWPGDPMVDSLDAFDGSRGMLAAGIGIEFSTRRRNKFAGSIFDVRHMDRYTKRLKIRVNQAIGNCPKYINIRDLVPHPKTLPKIIRRELHLYDNDRLPPEAISFITSADTVFLGSSYNATPENSRKFPSHVGMNQRGGRAGFIRVLPSDGRTIVLPDYSGNRLMTSLGNIEASRLASMTFVDFLTGDILYLTGSAENLVGAPARALMPRQNVLTRLKISGYVFVRDALPVRQRPGSGVERSPYSPPVKLLAEEIQNNPGAPTSFDDVLATVSRMEILSPTLAHFTFETSQPVVIQPGQAAILDFSDLLGSQAYSHMAPGAESSLNDDRVRTWTVSSAHVNVAADGAGGVCAAPTTTFDLTMRLKDGGLVTGALFAIARQVREKMPLLMAGSRELGLSARLVGISGAFTLPPLVSSSGDAPPKFLWIAGGIGITPFLSMLSALTSVRFNGSTSPINIDLLLSTREPDVLLRLLAEALNPTRPADRIRLRVHTFTKERVARDIMIGFEDVTVEDHNCRFGGFEAAALLPTDVKSRAAYLCGPQDFEDSALQLLAAAGYPTNNIIKEGFEY